MKTIFVLFLTIISLAAVLPSCEKDKKDEEVKVQQPPPVTLDSMIQCHSRTAWDSATIHDALIGKWKWEYISCYWSPEKANGEDFKTLSVEFLQNDSLIVRLNNQVSQNSSWTVTALNDGYFKLTVSPIVLQIPGRVLICGDRVVFQDSYSDGCDNYFKKQN